MKEIKFEETGTTIEEHWSERLGIDLKEVKIEKVEDVLTGENLAKAKRFMENIAIAKNCHYNTALFCDWTFEGYEVTFCEGLAGDWLINHCWTCLTNKETGEKRYIDITLDEESDAYIFNEWSRKDIWDLFNTCKYAFIPHREMWQYLDKNNKTRKLYNKYYPNCPRVRLALNSR